MQRLRHAVVGTILLSFAVALLWAQSPKPKTSSPSKSNKSAAKAGVSCDDKSLHEYKRDQGLSLFNLRSSKIVGYDADSDLDWDEKHPSDHAEICLSYSNGDTIVWERAKTHKPFKLKIEHATEGEKNEEGKSCPDNPFRQNLPDPEELKDQVGSGFAVQDAVGCHYKVKIKRPDKPNGDPHLVIGH